MPHPGGSVHSRKSQDASYPCISSQRSLLACRHVRDFTLTHSGREPEA